MNQSLIANNLDGPPQADLDIISRYPKIHNYIVMDWRTVRLKKFFDQLMCGEDNVGRVGFPADVSKSLVSLALLNIQQLEALGMNFTENPVSQFAITGWELPENF
jgi:hypothetical protein